MTEELLIKILPNLGVGIAAVVVLYFAFKLAIEALDKRERAFREYVQENNHKIAEILVAAKNAICKSSEFIQQSTEVLKEVRDHLIRERR